MAELKLVGICGSLRKASTNRMLMMAAVEHFGPASFEEMNIDWPVYNGDVEAEGIPEAVLKADALLRSADAVIVTTPEYNKGISGALKNALDWLSRTKTQPWAGRPVAVMSAAAGMQGGARAQSMLRHCLNPFRPHVIPGPEVMLGQSGQQFDENGKLTNEGTQKFLAELIGQLRDLAEARQS